MMTVWGWVGFGALIFLAGLQGIPQDLIEAAQIDGCTRTRAFWRIQVPLLRPVSGFLLVWLTINALQLFDEVYVTTKGGPLHATTVVVYYLYQQAFEFFHAGYAAAIAVVLFVAIAVITVVQMRRQPRPRPGAREHELDRRRRSSGSRAARPPWHLVLIPLALLMACRWSGCSSPACPRWRRPGASRPSCRRSLHWDNYVQAWTDSPFGALAAQQHDRLGHLRHQQPRAVQPGGLRLRAAARSPAAGCCSSASWRR